MRPKVLIIDDSKLVHALLADGLEGEEVDCLHAHDADQGFWFAERAQPDLILLDVIMPRTNGFDLCRALKNDAKTTHIPIIFLSGASDSLNKVQGLDLGAIDFITKPCEMGELQARVRAALRTKSLIDLLASSAQMDALTRLRNRRYFDERLDEELAAARRFGRAVSLILLDIDHFKQVNDRFGHLFGDRVLQEVAKTLSSSLREIDVACRYGGEEFAVILTETDLAGGVQVAERLRQTAESFALAWRGQGASISVSCGVASSTQATQLETLSAPILVYAADQALYVAKSTGRNRVVTADQVECGEDNSFLDTQASAAVPPSVAPLWEQERMLTP